MTTTLPEGKMKHISVNRQAIPRGEAPISIRCHGNTYAATDVYIAGPSRMHYDPDKPKSPRVWLETREEIVFV